MRACYLLVQQTDKKSKQNFKVQLRTNNIRYERCPNNTPDCPEVVCVIVLHGPLMLDVVLDNSQDWIITTFKKLDTELLQSHPI